MIIETVAESRAGNTAPRPGPIATGVYSLLLVLIEVLMQTFAFSIIYFNTTKQFSFPTATIVFLIELAKFVLCYIAFCPQQKRVCFLPSAVYLIPAVLFVTASNVFFYCLNFMPPTTWNVFVQSRTLFTALGGYIVFGRPIGREKWLAAVPLLMAVSLAVFFCPEVQTFKPAAENEEKKDTTEKLLWVVAVVGGVACSAFSVNSAEFISKVASRPVAEKHIQLHFFCTVLSFTWAELVTNGNLFEINMKMFFPLDFYMCLLNLIVGTLGGLAATFITVNRLSNPTDDASTITAWISPTVFIASSIVSFFLFPTQGYPYLVTAAIVFLMGATSCLYSTSAPSLPVEHVVGTRQDA